MSNWMGALKTGPLWGATMANSTTRAMANSAQMIFFMVLIRKRNGRSTCSGLGGGNRLLVDLVGLLGLLLQPVDQFFGRFPALRVFWVGRSRDQLQPVPQPDRVHLLSRPLTGRALLRAVVVNHNRHLPDRLPGFVVDIGPGLVFGHAPQLVQGVGETVLVERVEGQLVRPFSLPSRLPGSTGGGLLGQDGGGRAGANRAFAVVLVALDTATTDGQGQQTDQDENEILHFTSP